MIKGLGREFVSLAFPAHFLLGEEEKSFEQFVPIYVGSNKAKVDLYLTVSHQGPQGQPLRQIEIFIDSERVEVPSLNRDVRFKKNISLTSAVDKAKSGNHDFSDQILTLRFRSDPTQQKTKDYVSINALVVVHGLDRGRE